MGLRSGFVRGFIAFSVPLLPCRAGAAEMTRIGGHSYIFPSAVFENDEVETGPVGTFLIELAWPEMRPLTTGEHAARPPRDGLRVLGNGAASVAGQGVPEAVLMGKLPAELSVATAPSTGIQARASGQIPPPRPAFQVGDAGGAVPGGGMVRVQAEVRQPTDATQVDVFVREPIARAEEFIVCAHGQAVSAPDCAQTFVAFNLILKVSYPRRLVTQWRDIHAGIVAFLQKYEVK